MKIGITYDLRQDYLEAGYGAEETAEFDQPATINAIDESLQSLGHETDRIGNIQNLVKRLGNGQRWDLVFNIAEGLRGFGREAQVPGLLEAYGIPYTFSDPMVLSLTLHKGMTKHVIRDLGIPTPDFAVVESAAELAGVGLALPLFAKPVAEGTGKGVTQASKIKSREQLQRVGQELLTSFSQPVLVEEFLPGREFTVGVLGTGSAARSIGVMEVVLLPRADAEVYSYRNKQEFVDLVEYHLVDDPEARQAAAVALAAWRGLGCRDAGRLDLRSDGAGAPSFIEVNPLAGLHPVHSDLCILANKVGLPYRGIIEAIVASARQRLSSP
ncbi:MAG: D-alanine--D-alanine ligase [Deltaproteobacteria bacterium CG23_combo_of_CG06-09_8_20_14_all_60_8]|nr:MAG: D-alanine--D-alanine ligase [Deltaproteobacteria bacterium CG23_combo_of_CG06-09_8_20_14_all_60_8]